ncbi:MAG: putative hydroxymethylpyrimidine transporter CytX [Clostridiales bacterium]|nr:putative hydroxymethylpyrimidine transporter CytX [Clostridiales bacterium]
MEKKKTSLITNAMIWFGAGVSISEILTGTYFASLGFGKGMAAILIGHIIGCVLFCLAGIIGGKNGKSSMESAKMSFGGKGALIFPVLNIVQLVGWTSVMISSGAAAAENVYAIGMSLWSIIIGVLVIVWLFVGAKNVNAVNTIALSLLFVLTIILSFVVFRGGVSTLVSGEAITFGAAVEMAVAMPLSWLPLISDYTKEAEKPVKASVVSSVVYFIISCWMYVIGMGMALFTNETDIAVIMVKAGLGIAGLIIVIFSTVTTTFLDVYSAGISSGSLSSKINQQAAAVIVCVIGTLLAIFTQTNYFESFLYFIGSVFAPMIAVQIVDWFIFKNDSSDKGVNIINLVVWAVGFVLYRISMNFDIILGNTFPVMLITGIICFIANKVWRSKNV